jgi:hypothetical protein
MTAVPLVFGLRSWLAISVRECIQLVFTTSPLLITTFPLGYEHSIMYVCAYPDGVNMAFCLSFF